MKIDTKGLQILLQEANALTEKRSMTRQEQARYSYLLAAISAVKSGATLEELDQERLNETEVRAGLPVTHRIERKAADPVKRLETRAWQAFIRDIELRDEATNHPIQSGFNTGLGHFVPVGWLNDTFAAMRAHDPLFDEGVVTYLKTDNGRPIQIPCYGDIENTATYVSENSDQSSNETDIKAPGAVMVNAYSFRSPLWRVSLEAAQDVEAMGSVVPLFSRFAADRVARGVGKELIHGDGAQGHITGIIQALQAAGVVPVPAVGSAGNTGGSESGANSIGSADLAKTYFAVDSAYRNNPKCAWLMNDNTLKYLGTLTDKIGQPLVKIDGIGEPMILGKKVRVSPSMDDLGPSNIPVLFGDLGYWVTRCAVDDVTRIQRYTQAPGLAERGEVGLRLFVRFDGVLAYTDQNSPAPMALLQNQS